MKDKLTKKYQKSLVFEDVLTSLNQKLKNSQEELYQENENDQTTIHVIGAPRSGTTLLTQLVLSNIEVGYINNFIATFWNAPLYGIHLSKKLIGEHYVSNFKSDFGRTQNLQEPHEFGYFWKHQLNYTDHLQQTYNLDHKIDWNTLKNVLYQMCLAFNKPILFKSFLYGFHINNAVKKMPNTLFIHIKRDKYQNAFSILKLRKKMFGDTSSWASMKPTQYSFLKDKDIYVQIMGQVLFLNHEYSKQLKSIPEANKLVVNYSTLCSNTENVINDVYNKINRHSKVEKILNIDNKVKETIVEIPEPTLNEFKKAEEWLLLNYSELRK